ncbi:MAG: hypothetical protein M3N12_00150 [Verrucomicrobiota bacterium]|nr:hypothetical protein [Verrucomicrobiota bacterium]
MTLVSSRTATDLFWKLRHPPEAVESSIDLCVFQDGNVRITKDAFELSPAAKNAVIAERESEYLHAGIPKRIAHAINEWAKREAQAKTSAHDSQVEEYAFDRER